MIRSKIIKSKTWYNSTLIVSTFCFLINENKDVFITTTWCQYQYFNIRLVCQTFKLPRRLRFAPSDFDTVIKIYLTYVFFWNYFFYLYWIQINAHFCNFRHISELKSFLSYIWNNWNLSYKTISWKRLCHWFKEQHIWYDIQ